MATRTYRGMTAEQRAEDRRARLLAAGLDQLGTTGYGATTIEGVCKAAGVTARHFYEHFASREDLLLAVYEQVLEAHRGAVAAALADAPADGVEPRVRAAVGAALEAWTADRRSTRVAFLEVVGVSPRVEARRQEAIREYVALVLAIGEDLITHELAPGPPRPLGARALVGGLIGLVEEWVHAEQPPATEALVDEATRFALAAI